MRKVLILVFVAGISIVCLGAWTVGAWAASAAANDFSPLAIGWGVADTKSRAANKAEKRCENEGGDPSTQAFSKADGPGWAAVHVSNDGDYVTHSYRYSSKRKAKNKGKQYCETSDGVNVCTLVKVFYDEYGPEKKNGKRLKPGNKGYRID